MANETQGTTPGTSAGPGKAGQAAETLREKGHDIAGAARESVSAVAGKAEQADEYARRAQEYITDAEHRLDSFIDATERLFEKGSRYTGQAKAWLDDHREYREKAEALVHKASEFRARVRSRMSQSETEFPGEQIGAGPGAREKFSEYRKYGMERVRAGATSATAFVRQNPMDTLLIGAAVGVLIGTAYKHLTAEEPYAGAEAYPGGYAAGSEGGAHGEL